MQEWVSEITQIEPGKMVTFGVDQSVAIETFAFEDVIFLLLQGRIPNPIERDLLRAVIVSHMSHGITGQSTLAVRMAADSRASFIHALIAGFSTGAGRYHQGGLEATMREITQLALVPAAELETVIDARLNDRDRIMGFGHRYHKISDPRAEELMRIAAKHEFNGKYTDLVLRLADILRTRKNIGMNIEAAGGALLLDLGFEVHTAHLFIVLGRSTMFAAAYAERLRQAPQPFPKIRVFDE